MICKVCGSDKVEIILDDSTWEYKGKRIEIDNCKVYHCNKCENDILDEECWDNVEKTLENFRNVVNLVLIVLLIGTAINGYNKFKEHTEKLTQIAMEYAYMEGQKDYSKGDIRIKFVNDENVIWIKSPWDSKDSTSKFSKPLYDGSNYQEFMENIE